MASSGSAAQEDGERLGLVLLSTSTTVHVIPAVPTDILNTRSEAGGVVDGGWNTSDAPVSFVLSLEAVGGRRLRFVGEAYPAAVHNACLSAGLLTTSGGSMTLSLGRAGALTCRAARFRVPLLWLSDRVWVAGDVQRVGSAAPAAEALGVGWHLEPLRPAAWAVVSPPPPTPPVNHLLRLQNFARAVRARIDKMAEEAVLPVAFASTSTEVREAERAQGSVPAPPPAQEAEKLPAQDAERELDAEERASLAQALAQARLARREVRQARRCHRESCSSSSSSSSSSGTEGGADSDEHTP